MFTFVSYTTYVYKNVCRNNAIDDNNNKKKKLRKVKMLFFSSNQTWILSKC